MEKQIPLIELELLCSECHLPLHQHTTIQLSNCASLRRTKDNITKHRIIEATNRKRLITQLKKDTKQ